jgi:hypothetical protein
MPKTLKVNSFASKRAQVLKECKNNKYVGTKLMTETPAPEEPTEFFPSECKAFYHLDIDVGIVKKRGGETLPKIHQKNDKRQKNVTFWLPPMQVKYSDLGKNGNLGKFTQDPSKAKFSVTLLPGMNKDTVEKGEEAIKFVKEWCDSAMGAAFHDENTWPNLTKNHEDDTSFVQAAHHSLVKDVDDQEAISLNRRLEGWNGEPNQPVFWKMKKDGGYEQVHPKFIRHGTILMVQMSFRAFKIPGGRYGMAGDLGKHILVVKTPEKEKPKNNTPFDIPYIPFELD